MQPAEQPTNRTNSNTFKELLAADMFSVENKYILRTP